jgi:hypothetical protein
MKIKFIHVFVFYLIFFSSSFNAKAQETQPNACRVMDIHCQCKNPHLDYLIKNQKVGKANPHEPGVCRSSKDIDELLKDYPLLYCTRGGKYQKDPRKGETTCSATWTCKKSCKPRSIGKHH